MASDIGFVFTVSHLKLLLQNKLISLKVKFKVYVDLTKALKVICKQMTEEHGLGR